MQSIGVFKSGGLGRLCHPLPHGEREESGGHTPYPVIAGLAAPKPWRRRARPQTNFSSDFIAIPPVQSSRKKHFAGLVGQIKSITPANLSHQRGVGHRRKRGAGSGGRKTATDERGTCVRRNRLGPTPRCRRQVRRRPTLPESDGVTKSRVTRTITYKP